MTMGSKQFYGTSLEPNFFLMSLVVHLEIINILSPENIFHFQIHMSFKNSCCKWHLKANVLSASSHLRIAKVYISIYSLYYFVVVNPYRRMFFPLISSDSGRKERREGEREKHRCERH